MDLDSLGPEARPDPLRRLRLDRVPSQVLEQVDPLDVREIVGRSSIPAPSASARSAVKLAALSLTERAAEGLPVLWAEAVTDAAAPTDDRLYERLDRIVVTTPLRANPPKWWQLMGWLQWVLGLFAVVGLAWLVVRGRRLAAAAADRHPEGGTVPPAHAATPGWCPARVAGRVGGPGSRPGGSATSSGGRGKAAAQCDRRRRDGAAGRAGPLGPRPASRDAGATGSGPPRLSRQRGCPQPSPGSSRRPQGHGSLWPAWGVRRMLGPGGAEGADADWQLGGGTAMNESFVTVVGNVVSDPISRPTKVGRPFASLRIASTTRRWDAEKRAFVDGSTNFLNVVAFNALAANVMTSVKKGHPVVVYGRLRVNQWETEKGEPRTSAEIDAFTIGHDLTRGQVEFTRPPRIQLDANDRLADPAIQDTFHGDDDGDGDGDGDGVTAWTTDPTRKAPGRPRVYRGRMRAGRGSWYGADSVDASRTPTPTSTSSSAALSRSARRGGSAHER